jgi:hypothetical protein
MAPESAAEILKLFEEIQFGKMPPRPRDLAFEVTDKGTPFLKERRFESWSQSIHKGPFGSQNESGDISAGKR